MKFLFLTGILCLSAISSAQTKYSTAEYVEMWKTTAVEQMLAHKIPASITLAQGILESANGNSRLAREAKNHFGIKCHSTWRGATFIQDDDKKDECFRSYKSASDSYNDHSLFLTGRKRYAGLFELKLHDYKGWAKGLKAAGYATNPKYAYLLIDIIERYNLNRFDKMTDVASMSQKELSVKPKRPIVLTKLPKKKTEAPKGNTGVENQESKGQMIEIKAGNHHVRTNKNSVRYVVVKEGDTFFRIAREFNITINQLYKYNEFAQKDVLEVGDIIYVAPKRIKAKRGNEHYTCKHDITLRQIAHEEGIRLASLMKMNLIEDPNQILKKGSKVILR